MLNESLHVWKILGAQPDRPISGYLVTAKNMSDLY